MAILIHASIVEDMTLSPSSSNIHLNIMRNQVKFPSRVNKHRQKIIPHQQIAEILSKQAIFILLSATWLNTDYQEIPNLGFQLD